MTENAVDPLRAVQLRAVATRFLRTRPWVVAVGALGNALLLVHSGAPGHQLAAVGACFSLLVSGFVLEAWLLRSRTVTERWLLASLLATALLIGVGAALTGGIESPFVPILFVPIVIAFAAFGRTRGTLAISASAACVVALLALLPEPLRGPAVAASHRGAMLAWSSAISLALLWLGVTGLVDAYVATARVLDRMRVDAIDQAAERARHAEAWGAKVAHEIRNPLTSIKGLVQLVARKNEDARDARRFEVVLGEVERVEGILDDYLRLARPLRDLSLESAGLDRIASDIGVLFEARASASGVTIALALEPAPAMVDPARVREALVNLAKNALEAMPAGGTLTLRACLAGERAQVEVIDTGPGIDAELLARLGDAFVSTREEGTGLGVALARGVARQHGGDLEIESEPGRGTRAVLWVPIARGD